LESQQNRNTSLNATTTAAGRQSNVDQALAGASMTVATKKVEPEPTKRFQTAQFQNQTVRK
jgi:hypothetical protein